MNIILDKLFQDNPGLPGEAAKFCRTIPGYREAEADFARQAAQISRLLGPELYLPFAMNAQLAYEVRAHYLFGLGLRREVLEALTQDQNRVGAVSGEL